MRAKQVKPVAPTPQHGQLTLFAWFDAAAHENPRTQALPAGEAPAPAVPPATTAPALTPAALRLPPPSSSGPSRRENPTTTALHGRRRPGEPAQDSALLSGGAAEGSTACVCPTPERQGTPEAGPYSPVRELARRVAALLQAQPQTRIDNARLDALTRDVFGSAAGHARDAYDAAEAGLNIYLDALALDDGCRTIERLLALTRRMPRQTRRDERQVEWQQFSTPPAQAFVVVAAAAIRPGMDVLEPSAGTGSLAVLARTAGGVVTTNEMDPRRADLLALQGFSVTTLDAERLDNLLEADQRFDAIVMNPPFSATGGRVSGHHTKFGARHVEQALLRLRPGGRLVAIVGQGMARDRAGFRDWWQVIEARYRLRANLGMDGNVYGKFGTSFGNQIIVIDHDGPTTNGDDVLTDTGLAPLAAYERLRSLGEEDIPARIAQAARPAKRHRNARRPGRETDGIGQLVKHAARPVAIETGTVFARYAVQKAIVRGAEPHPANVVESTTMASVEPPDVTYQHHLPPELIVEGRVSDLQIEDTLYAGQATQTLLPDGNRRGHWNGDGTGIGKGREIYAFLYDQFQQGRRKHVHISASHQLVVDAQRDRDAVGLPLPILHQARLQPKQVVSAAEGVFFTTYTMLAQDFNRDRPRFKQLVDWLGQDFDGVIAFDEAHLMKNAAATPYGGKATTDSGTQRGNMGIALQRMFPQARVRYFSATGATEVRHMAAYERLGLWGQGAPFPDFPAFVQAMERGGVAAMEMLCRDLKAVGSYLSRTISYGPSHTADGSIVPDSAVEYEPLQHTLTAAECTQYDAIADLWSQLLIAFERAEQTAGQRRSPDRYAQFYATQQRFFLQLMMAYELPDVVPAIERDLAAGRSVVVSLFNTHEAQTDRKVSRALADGLDLSELDATPREMIVQLIEKQFPIHQYHEVTDPQTGKVRVVPVKDRHGHPEINRENRAQQAKLLDQVADLDFPQNPIDTLLTHFGPENVAEITGRSHRLERGKYVRRKIHGVGTKRLNEHETRQFQNGHKRLAIVSGAGATGISLHADVDAQNHQRRVFYAFQLSWSADQQMQVFGRVHRSHQVSAPIIRLVLLDLAGQKRQVNAVSKRLAALGALTKGERQSLGGALFRPEDVTDAYGAAALARFYQELTHQEHMDAGLGLRELARMGVLDQDQTAVRENFLRKVNHFLNRIMVLPVAKQNALFERFYERYLETVDAAKQRGAFDFGVSELRARNLRNAAPPQTLHMDPASGARTVLHELEGEIDVERYDFETAQRRFAGEGFYRNDRGGTLYAVAAHPDDALRRVVLVSVRRASRVVVERHELTAKYTLVSSEAARMTWDAAYAATPAIAKERFHVLSGAILPIFDKLMGGGGLDNTKVVRALLETGEALVGFHLNPKDIAAVKQRLGIDNALADASPSEILVRLNGGATIELDNGWQLVLATISGDQVIELVLSGMPVNKEELRGYGFMDETIRFKRRWFVPMGTAEQVLPRLLARRRPVRESVPGEAA